jgi:hypothetical protein
VPVFGCFPQAGAALLRQAAAHGVRSKDMRQIGLGARGGTGMARLCRWPFSTTFAEAEEKSRIRHLIINEAAVTASEIGEEVVARL